MPNIPDDEQTIIPKRDWRGAQFIKTLNVTGADGNQRRFDECARDISKDETERIARLAPARDDEGQWLFVAAFVLGLLFVGGCIGYCIGVH